LLIHVVWVVGRPSAWHCCSPQPAAVLSFVHPPNNELIVSPLTSQQALMNQPFPLLLASQYVKGRGARVEVVAALMAAAIRMAQPSNYSYDPVYGRESSNEWQTPPSVLLHSMPACMPPTWHVWVREAACMAPVHDGLWLLTLGAQMRPLCLVAAADQRRQACLRLLNVRLVLVFGGCVHRRCWQTRHWPHLGRL
jgi:hypothetical protein